MKLSILAAISLLMHLSSAFDIRDFGAIADEDSLAAEQMNSQALMDAIVAANFTESDRIVTVPNMTFHSMPVWASGV